MKTLFKNATIYDGSGSSPFLGDLLISEDKILKVSKNLNEKVDEEIDCTGKKLAPGFIDAHSHNDYFCFREDSKKCLQSFILQGITTQVVGNCGYSVIGVDENSPYKEYLNKSLFNSKWYGSLEDAIKKYSGKLFLNIIPLVGHGSVRTSVVGWKSKKLTKDELNQMLALLERDLKAGAFGGSLGLMYEPGMFADTAELTEFAKIIKKYNGILTIHPRACSDVSQGFPLTKKHHLELGLDEFASILKNSGVRGEYSHLIFTGSKSWNRVDSMINKFKELQKEGLDIGYDMYSYTFGASAITIFLFPDFLAIPEEKRMHGFPYLKARFLMSISMKMVLGMTYDDIVVAYIGKGYEKYEGKKLSEIAKEEKLNNVQTYFKLVNLSKGMGRVYIDKYYNKEILEKLMKDENSIFMTDAWFEETGIQQASAYSCFPNFFKLGKEFGIKEETLIHKMTGKTADRFRIKNRGYLKEGYKADLVLFDDIKIVNQTGEIEGINKIYINGKKVAENGKLKDVQSGEFILNK